ncbi:MAG: M48 family metalloprotease, partial [Kiloniellales bacterium]
MRLLRKGSAFLLAVCLFALSLLAPPGAGAKGPTIIRDAEIEDTIRAYATPLFRAAGLNPSAIEVYLIQDNSLNAFVTGGMRMFIHTGLLMRADDPLEVIGVIAHETGHISGG